MMGEWQEENLTWKRKIDTDYRFYFYLTIYIGPHYFFLIVRDVLADGADSSISNSFISVT